MVSVSRKTLYIAMYASYCMDAANRKDFIFIYSYSSSSLAWHGTICSFRTTSKVEGNRHLRPAATY